MLAEKGKEQEANGKGQDDNAEDQNSWTVLLWGHEGELGEDDMLKNVSSR